MRHIALLLILLITCDSCKQNNVIKGTLGNINESAIDTVSQNTNHNPDLILVVGDNKIVLDSVKIQEINPDWIDKVEVVKGVRAESLFTDTIKVIYVYPKRKYYSEIKKLLK